MPIRLKLLLASLLLAATTAGLGLFAVGAERELGRSRSGSMTRR